jgi:hypothetical protein
VDYSVYHNCQTPGLYTSLSPANCVPTFGGDPRTFAVSLGNSQAYQSLLPEFYPAARRESEKLAPTSTAQRLSLISRHLDQALPLPELNTPFSTERNSFAPDDIEYKPVDRSIPPSPSKEPQPTMSIQAPHNTLLIPGPIEFDDAVLQSMSHYA